MDSAKQLRELSKVYIEAVYGQSPEKEEAKRRKDDDLAGSPKKKMVVTRADIEGGTEAAKRLKQGDPRYVAADHVKEGKDESPEAEEEKDKEDDDLAGSPNKKGKGKKAKRWWDDDGDGKGYEDGEVDGKFKKKKKDDVKESTVETYGTKGKLKKELKDLGKGANTLKGKNIEKADEVAEQKDTPDQVAAVIDMYRSKKGTDAATYDSEHGKKKAAKKERDYAKWERDKMARDAQKSGHPWEHAKGSTTEKEGKKSVKHAHVQDSYNWQNESKEAEEYLDTVSQVKKSEEDADIKRWSALKESGQFSEEELKNIIWNEGYQRDPEGGEEKERQRRRSQKGGDTTEKVRGERTPMPPRGDKRREDFERWYAANVR